MADIPPAEVPSDARRQRRSSGVNWPLRIGYLIVLPILFIAVAGPYLAPRDPLEREAAVRIGGRFYGPPFPAFRSLDYPLGSDAAGRDTFSRLLWGVQPTMIMVGIVAGTRLLLGLAIGLAAGWSRRLAGHVLGGLISGALALPILLVALTGIAVVGIRRGLLAFIVGLALTGWAETASLVAAQTRLLRDQPYVEAARALGASSVHVLLRHVARHILPLLGMLFAFEISGTLLVAAALGFLGYYIGGGIRIEIDQGITRNFTESPELGQLLATALISLIHPGPMVAVGTLIFVIVLGFNLLGEGLRREAEVIQHRSGVFRLAGRLGARVQKPLLVMARPRQRGAVLGFVAALVLVAVAGLGWAWWQGRLAAEVVVVPTTAPAPPPADALDVPGGHLWASAYRDALGTRWAPAGDMPAPEVRWTFEDPSGFTGGPVVAADGTVYVAATGGTLYALLPDGTVRWQVTLPAGAIGSPALGLDGTVYIADQGGGLSAFTPDGRPLWQVPGVGRQATSGPIVGRDGTIYYTIVDAVRAVSPEGRPRWTSPAIDSYTDETPLLSPTGDLVFLGSAAFDARDGTKQDLQIVENEDPFAQSAYIMGADGRRYYRSSGSVIEWRHTPAGVERGQTLKPSIGFVAVDPTGVTEQGLIWTLYASEFDTNRIIWTDMHGTAPSEVEYPLRSSRLLAMTADNTAYICGERPGQGIVCSAMNPSTTEMTWTVQLGARGTVVGGALVPGRLYVATAQGSLYAIGDGEAA